MSELEFGFESWAQLLEQQHRALQLAALFGHNDQGCRNSLRFNNWDIQHAQFSVNERSEKESPRCRSYQHRLLKSRHNILWICDCYFKKKTSKSRMSKINLRYFGSQSWESVKFGTVCWGNQCNLYCAFSPAAFSCISEGLRYFDILIIR